jgi:dienelactone hydrolase
MTLSSNVLGRISSVLVKSRIVYPRARVAAVRGAVTALAVAAMLLGGCGGTDSASRVAELAEYDAKKPLRLEIQGENRGQIDVTYQSPRGGDVPATLVLPERRQGRLPVVVWSHPFLSSRAHYFREAFTLAGDGVASLLVDAAVSRPGRPDLMDPVYAADAFKALVRQDVVDLRRGLDFLATRGEIDIGRVAVVGQEYGVLPAGALAAVDERVDAVVLAVAPAEPGRYWAKEFVPQESHDSFAAAMRDFDPIRLLDGVDADVLIQNPRRDDDFPAEEYERLEDEAGDADFRWYDYGHQLGPQADDDRRRWLLERLRD